MANIIQYLTWKVAVTRMRVDDLGTRDLNTSRLRDSIPCFISYGMEN